MKGRLCGPSPFYTETFMKLTGKTALITGSGRGIGLAIAQRFKAEGAHVLQCDIQGDVDFKIDVADEVQVEKMFSQISHLNILVNNAGILIEAPTHEMKMEDFDRVMAVNLRGPVLCARAAIRHFLSRPGGGVILSNSSVAQVIPKPGFLSYSISKGALENYTKTIALEYAPQGIRANNVGPGAILTDMNASWKDHQQRRAIVESHIPMGYAVGAEQIAAVFAFLASDDAKYITGQTIFADGGLTLYPEFRENWST